FAAPFLHGTGWSPADDAASTRVAVISKSLNDRVFGGGNSVGRTLVIGGNAFRVAGVLDHWRPAPRFYDMNSARYRELAAVLAPSSASRALDVRRSGSMDCWGDSGGDETALNAPCVWIQYWVELEGASQAADSKAYLDNYSAQKKATGRFEREPT